MRMFGKYAWLKADAIPSPEFSSPKVDYTIPAGTRARVMGGPYNIQEIGGKTYAIEITMLDGRDLMCIIPEGTLTSIEPASVGDQVGAAPEGAD